MGALLSEDGGGGGGVLSFQRESACCLSLSDSGFKKQSMSEQLNKQSDGRIFCLSDLFSNVWECQGDLLEGAHIGRKVGFSEF